MGNVVDCPGAIYLGAQKNRQFPHTADHVPISISAGRRTGAQCSSSDSWMWMRFKTKHPVTFQSKKNLRSVAGR
ncbi:Hypothetical protein FKW44_014192 [Caligus rogercresseyi]|uniref:Uncharacterized protein n=1 Tax=Caligus rogercresseyi TaxID=217165 RepID=A0A7T8GYI0_CALRO|nr:Hypothetical protein FKW44_014192 [Caligus rogercresseyi]